MYRYSWYKIIKPLDLITPLLFCLFFYNAVIVYNKRTLLFLLRWKKIFFILKSQLLWLTSTYYLYYIHVHTQSAIPRIFSPNISLLFCHRPLFCHNRYSISQWGIHVKVKKIIFEFMEYIGSVLRYFFYL